MRQKKKLLRTVIIFGICAAIVIGIIYTVGVKSMRSGKSPQEVKQTKSETVKTEAPKTETRAVQSNSQVGGAEQGGTQEVPKAQTAPSSTEKSAQRMVEINPSTLPSYEEYSVNGVVTAKNMYLDNGQLYFAFKINLDSGLLVEHFVTGKDVDAVSINSQVTVDYREYKAGSKTYRLIDRVGLR